MMTTVLILAEQALMQMAESLGETIPPPGRLSGIRLRMGLSALWDERSGRYGFLHGRGRSLQTPDVLASYMPLILEEDAQRRSRLIDGLQSRYLTPVPLPSTAPEDPGFVAQSYWRGPVWWSEAWLILPALSPAMRETIQSRLLACVAREAWEYFHPMTGQGLGSPTSWTAALARLAPGWMTGAG